MACTPQELVELSRCLLCLSAHQLSAIITYQLAVLAGVPRDRQSLVTAANCLLCLSPLQLAAIDAVLLCQYAEATGETFYILAETGAILNAENSDRLELELA